MAYLKNFIKYVPIWIVFWVQQKAFYKKDNNFVQ